MIRAVLFDIDGVLVDSFEANYDWFVQLAKEAGREIIAKEEHRKYMHLTSREYVRQIIGVTDEVEIERLIEFGKTITYGEAAPLILAPHARETLELLKKEYKLGMVTSRTRHWILWPPVDTIADYFSTSIAYEDVNNHKPHPDCLLLAASKLSVRPEECVYIGDMPSDVEAAHAAGMKVILYGDNQADTADATATSFTQLPALVQELSSVYS